MIGRSTVYNRIVNDEKWSRVNEENKELMDDFIEYLHSVDKSNKTIYQYTNNLKIYFVWNLEYNKNKDFVDITKREFAKFQNWCLNTLDWSPARMKSVKSCISSLGTYIENILDDEYEDFKSIVNKVPSPANEKVREKSVIPEEKVQYLLDTLVDQEKYQEACMVAVAAYSGMRKAELLQMKVSFFTDDKLDFNGAMWKTDKIRTKGRGKKGKQLNKYVLIGAKPYIDMWLKKREELGIEEEYLFVTKIKGKYEARRTADSFVTTFSEIIEMPFYWHSLRHYLVTKFSAMNLPAEVIREFIGWNDISLISVYDDNEISEKFGVYFTQDGVVKQESGSLE